MNRAAKRRHTAFGGLIATCAVGLLLGCGTQASSLEALPAHSATSATATEIFLVARRERAVAFERRLATLDTTVTRDVAATEHACPTIVTTAPRGTRFKQLSFDAVAGIGAIATQVSRSTLKRFAASTRSLTWRNPEITALVRHLAHQEEMLARIRPIDICRVLASWVQDGYRRLPAAAVAFDRQLDALTASARKNCGRVAGSERVICAVPPSPSPEVEILRLLRPLENHRYQQIAEAVERTERIVANHTHALLRTQADRLTRSLDLSTSTLRQYEASLE
jgi:hypothetical protein